MLTYRTIVPQRTDCCSSIGAMKSFWTDVTSNRMGPVQFGKIVRFCLSKQCVKKYKKERKITRQRIE